ncbi:MAG: tyrosine-type recombinase/integrase [Elusimicrobiota bacterium]|jgi:integrase/recombinase XerD
MARTTVGSSLNANPITLVQASEAFRLRCQAQNLSPSTLIWYGEVLKPWLKFLESQGVTQAREVTPNLIRLSFEDMRRRGVSRNTVARAYGGLRCFFGFLARERMIPQNPFQLVEKPRMEKKLIKPLSLDQARLLLAPITTKRWTDHNLRTIMVLILDTGLRISEVIGLRRDQVDFHAGVLRVMGKGAKEREVPFGSTAKQALWSYMARRGDLPGQDLLFVNRYGGRLCRHWIEKAMRNLGRKAGIEGVRGSPHTLRHTFAVLYIRNGGDSFSLQEILGHSTLEMTRRYVHLARRDVAEQHKKFSPVEGLLKDSKAIGGPHMLRSSATPLSVACDWHGCQ